jgi:O-antigen/teichoic acid export membrane protein
MTIVSLTAMAMFADLGLGNGLLTRLAACAATKDFSVAKTLISTAYVSLAGVALVLMALVMVILPSLDWAALLNLSPDFDPAAIRTVAVLCVSAFAVTIPLSLIQRVQYAFGDAWKSNVWQVVGAMFTVASVYAAASSGAGYGLVIAAAVFGSPLVMLLNNVFYYAGHTEIRPGFRPVSAQAAGSLLRIGLGFLILSVLTSLSLNLDNLIVANVADVSTVSNFAVTTKLFSILAMAVTLVALPLWPANGEALARDDRVWVQKTTRKMVLFSVGLVGLGGGVLLALRDLIAKLWLGEGNSISLALGVNLVLWSMLLAFSSPFFSVQNSVGVLRYQFIGWFFFVITSVPLKFWFYSAFGLSGIPLAGAVAYLIFLCPAAVVGYRATLRGIRGTAKNQFVHV